MTDIDYNGHKVNLAEYGESRDIIYKKGRKKGKAETIRKEFWFLTDLPVSRKNVTDLAERGRMRWKIENEGFNAQKRQGYNLGHQYSRNYQALKNHYYLIQIGHMIGQLMECWEKSKAERGTKTQEDPRIHERDPVKRTKRRGSQKDTNTVYIESNKERKW